MHGSAHNNQLIAILASAYVYSTYFGLITYVYKSPKLYVEERKYYSHGSAVPLLITPIICPSLLIHLMLRDNDIYKLQYRMRIYI